MKKNGKNGNLRLVCLSIFAIFWVVLMTLNVVGMCIHCKNKKAIIPQKEFLWEDSQESDDELDMSEIRKKYRSRRI